MKPLKNKTTSGTKNPLNDDEKKFILDNYETMTVPQMKKELSRSPHFIYGFLDEKKLQAHNPYGFGTKRPIKETTKKGCFDHSQYEKMF